MYQVLKSENWPLFLVLHYNKLNVFEIWLLVGQTKTSEEVITSDEMCGATQDTAEGEGDCRVLAVVGSNTEHCSSAIHGCETLVKTHVIKARVITKPCMLWPAGSWCNYKA